MIRQFNFQTEAIDWLINTSLNPSSKQTVVLKAPTGSGKTIMLIQYIEQYLSNYDTNTAFIWLCPGKGDLEEQSYNKMRELYSSRQTNDLFDALQNGFEAGSVSFINWERVTKKGNKAITDGEKKNLYERIKQAHNHNVNFIIIVDEEHSNNTAKARDIIDAFSASHIIRVSATTVANRDVEYKEIDEQDVIDEGLITKAISVNEDIEDGIAQDDAILLELADKKRKQIIEHYNNIGKVIRPLVLIQFPNGSPEKIEAVESKLEDMGYTRKNKTVAAWLSGDKGDIPENLTDNNSQLDFLFIKQAINTGWDCPRAKILVKLREGGDEAFQVQTIGRIRRMPEAHHYEDSVLDMCYVYTFDQEYKTGLLTGLDKAYIPKRLFLKEKCRDLVLTKELRDMDGGTADDRQVYHAVRNRFINEYSLDNDKELNMKKLAGRGYKFGDELFGSIVGGVFTTIDSLPESARNIETRTPVDTHEHGMQLRHTFDEFKNVLGVEARTLRRIFDKLFSIKFQNNSQKLLRLPLREYYAFVINNSHLIKEELRVIASEVTVQNRLLMPKTEEFRLPLEELYHFDPVERDHSVFESSAYKDYTAGYVTSACGKSDSEIMFEQYCEEHKQDIDWVYKNGDSGQQYLSLVYMAGISDRQKLFYPDYILRKKDGTVWIIEAKGGQRGNQDNNIDPQVLNKFIRLKAYAEAFKLHWGFVRNMNHKLYINNSEYVDDMHNDSWKPLNEVL